MSFKYRWSIRDGYLGLLLSAFVILPGLAWAQTPPGGLGPRTRPERPYRGLFGGSVGATAQSLTFDGSIGGGTNESSRPGAAGATGNGLSDGGGGAVTGSGNISYSMDKKRWGLSASNAVFFDYYPGGPDGRGGGVHPRDIAGAAGYFNVARATRVTVGLTYKNLPEFTLSDLYGVAAGDVIPLRQDYGLVVDRYSRYGGSVDLTQTLSRHAHASVSTSYARGMIGSRSWTILLYSGSISYSISKGLSLFAGYQDGGQKDEGPGLDNPRDRHPRMNFGIDYNKPLSFSRRTTVMLTTGTAGTYDRLTGETQYHLIGSALLNRELGRTWSTAIMYSRNLQYIESLGEPLFSDSLSVGVQGQLARAHVQSRFGASSGHLGTDKENKAGNYFGAVQLSLPLNRMWALTADYAYYRYTTPATLRQFGSREHEHYQSLRGYVQVSLPLLTRKRQ